MNIEQFQLEYCCSGIIDKKACVGVVSSGDLELLIEPASNGSAIVNIRTQVIGYKHIWEEIFRRFFHQHNVAAIIHVNDCGATPGVINLRLLQLMEEINS